MKGPRSNRGTRMPAAGLGLFYLQEVEIDRRLPAKEGDEHADLAALLVDGIYCTHEVGERAILDADRVALFETDPNARSIGRHLPEDTVDLSLLRWNPLRA